MIQVSLVGYFVGGMFLNLAYWDMPYYLMIALVVTWHVLKAKAPHPLTPLLCLILIACAPRLDRRQWLRLRRTARATGTANQHRVIVLARQDFPGLEARDVHWSNSL